MNPCKKCQGQEQVWVKKPKETNQSQAPTRPRHPLERNGCWVENAQQTETSESESPQMPLKTKTILKQVQMKMLTSPQTILSQNIHDIELNLVHLLTHEESEYR